MRVLVCPDSYKGTLTAVDAAAALAAGLPAASPCATLDLLPLADGGWGSLTALAASIPMTFRYRRGPAT